MSPVHSVRNVIHRIAHTGVLPTDTEDERLRKETPTMVVVIIVPLTTVWTVTYVLLEQRLIAAFLLAYRVLSLSGLLPSR